MDSSALTRASGGRATALSKRSSRTCLAFTSTSAGTTSSSGRSATRGLAAGRRSCASRGSPSRCTTERQRIVLLMLNHQCTLHILVVLFPCSPQRVVPDHVPSLRPCERHPGLPKRGTTGHAVDGKHALGEQNARIQLSPDLPNSNCPTPQVIQLFCASVFAEMHVFSVCRFCYCTTDGCNSLAPAPFPDRVDPDKIAKARAACYRLIRY